MVIRPYLRRSLPDFQEQGISQSAKLKRKSLPDCEKERSVFFSGKVYVPLSHLTHNLFFYFQAVLVVLIMIQFRRLGIEQNLHLGFRSLDRAARKPL